jgi:hypothetical protein
MALINNDGQRMIMDQNEFSNADKAVAIIGEAAAEAPHTLHVFQIWVTMFVYFRKKHPELSTGAILTLVKQEWGRDKQDIIADYLGQKRIE